MLFVETSGIAKLLVDGESFSQESIAMEGVSDELLVSAARQLKGRQRRIFLADVCS